MILEFLEINAYYITSIIVAGLILVGISLMSNVKTAKIGNLIGALATFFAVVITLINFEIMTVSIVVYTVLISVLIGTLIGVLFSSKVKMIQMPELVALLNGLGGAASAIVGAATLYIAQTNFEFITSLLALIIGLITLVGSLVAAGKLSKMISSRPIVIKLHQQLTIISISLIFIALPIALFVKIPLIYMILIFATLSISFGWLFSIRVGGADMPITISLLNSFSGVAGAIAGMAINNVLLVAIGGVVGASGLVLTQIMCQAMNRKLSDILFGITTLTTQTIKFEIDSESKNEPNSNDYHDIIYEAKKVIIVPGYGMALSQAQFLVKQLSDMLKDKGTEVKFAIHPVAGRMPGHMNVLLAEADISYEKLYEMNQVNNEFSTTDLVIVVGANDVINPAANTAENTPIYQMPILNVADAKHIIICNYDTAPGYAGVDNPLYHSNNVSLLLGDAKESINRLISYLNDKKPNLTNIKLKDTIKGASSIIIVPGYGMALSQAQHLVKQLSSLLENDNKEVLYGIHPVAGRMPGHMNVLLAEADVEYDKLYDMDTINPKFKTTDLVIVVGANDVINPAANTAIGTPIYQMPILNVVDAKHIIICNFDASPGYAGVANPLYKNNKVTLLLGDAKESLQKIINEYKD